MRYLYLTLAIVFEVMGTVALKEADGFRRLWPVVAVFFAYGVSFFFLSFALRYISVGVAYAIWSGAGIILITCIGVARYRQTPDVPAVIGLILIAAGILVLRLFSKMD